MCYAQRMGATWIAKPVSALTTGELKEWHGVDWGPNLAPSQTPEWGTAGIQLGVEPILVFSPERRISALFFRKGSEAECANGPVYEWTRIDSATEQNELIGMTVHALLKCNPEITRVTLRPRMAEAELDPFLERTAFPADGVDRSSTMILSLQSPDESDLFQTLGPRIRHEVRRAGRSQVKTEQLDSASAMAPFWKRCSDLYSKKGLWIPPVDWIRSFVDHPDHGISIFRSTHLPTGSLCEVLVFEAGTSAFNLFAAESRTSDCPNLSLNASAQWEAIKTLHKLRLRTYDLNGVSHPDTETPEGFLGVDAYKKKFKGRSVRFAHPVLRFG